MISMCGVCGNGGDSYNQQAIKGQWGRKSGHQAIGGVMLQVDSLSIVYPPSSPPKGSAFFRFDPEMLYVECSLCGRPVFWGEGMSTLAVAGAGIAPSTIDSRCMILTNGCEYCKPHDQHDHVVVRLSSSGHHDRLMDDPAGRA